MPSDDHHVDPQPLLGTKSHIDIGLQNVQFQRNITRNRPSRKKSRRIETLEDRCLLAGDLIAHWRADSIVDAAAVVSEWTDSVSQISSISEGTPMLSAGTFGGRDSVRFDGTDGSDGLHVALGDNPVNSLSAFSIVVAFSTDSDSLAGTDGPWYEATGLVDANALGFSQDWGVAINQEGRIGVGLGGGFGTAPVSLYSTQAGLNDGDIHVATFTASAGQMSLYVDDAPVDQRNDGHSQNRSRLRIGIGSLSNGNGAFTGEIAEVRMYNDALTTQEVQALHDELGQYYGNSEPIANPDTYSFIEDDFFLIVNAANGVLSNDTDADGDPLTAQLIESTANGTLTLRADGSFIYDSDANFFGEDTFTYAANDFRNSEPTTVTITVNPAYDPAVAFEDTYKSIAANVLNVSAAEGVLANDLNIDQTELTAVLSEDVTAGSLALNADGSFSYDPQGFAGTMTFKYQVDDGMQLTPATTVTLIINTPPETVNDAYTLDEDNLLSVAAGSGVSSNDIDLENDAVVATLIDPTSNGQLTFEQDGSFSYVPNADFFGEDVFTYRLSDGVDESASLGVATLTVNPVNDKPVGRTDLVVTFINETLNLPPERGLLANDFDIDSPTITARLTSPPQNGELAVNQDGSLSFTPTPDFTGTDSFSYVANDGELDSDEVTVSVVVASADQQIAINEVHYDPPENTVPAEFIELVNQGSTPADLSNWFFSDGITFVIPEGTVVLPGEHLVVAQDPATIKSVFDVDSIGPWTGRLSSEGERIVLRNANREPVDVVDYQQGFPWPIAAGGDGPSMELINPTLDNDLGGSWRSGTNPTPGTQNTVFAANAAPQIRQVSHTPQQPTSEQPTTITAKVTDPNGVKAVDLQYQIVLPGSYIPTVIPFTPRDLRRNADTPREINPEYYDPANWTTISMVDDGTGGDAEAGDDIFTAVIPGQNHRTLVRYQITVIDPIDKAIMVPYADDAAKNFAYFVYDGIPEYNGHSREVMDSLPAYHLIARNEDITSVMAYSGRDQIAQGSQARFTYNWPATMVFDGKVYDNINFRLRGANGRYHQRGKRSMRFRFNDGSYFEAKDQNGEPLPEKLRTLTTGKMFDNRGTLTYSLNESVTYKLYQTIGLPAINTHYGQFYVIDDTEEAPDQWNGDYWGFNYMMETYDVRFLDAHGLERGNLYKLINQTRDWEQQQRYQAPNAVTGGEDHDNIERRLTGNSTAEYIDAHVNLEKYYLYHGLVEAVRHYDYWPDANKNMVYYFEPDYLPENDNLGKLWILPWDTDATWGPTWNSGHDVVYNSIFPASGGGADRNDTPELWPAYFNVVREIRDLLWQPDQIEPFIEQVASILRPMEQADRDRWRGGPTEAGTYNGLTGKGTESIDALVQDMKNFAFVGGSWPGGSVGRGGRADDLDDLQRSRGEGDQIPMTPTIRYIGEPNFPSTGLRFATSNFADPQGNDSFGAMEWRVAEVTDPNAPAFDPNEDIKFEWNASWESGELAEFQTEIAPPSSAVVAGHSYRARVRMQDDTGRWSHWSEPVSFIVSAPTSSDLVDALRISEIHFHPADPSQSEVAAGHSDADDFEFLEIENISSSTLDITGAQLVAAELEGDPQGVRFDFTDSAITQLAPGERLVVVEDVEAFRFRYGDDIPVAGQWTGGLSNGGEQLTLLGDGFTIQQFVYSDDWYPETDGDGPSLEIVNVNGDLQLWGQKEGWKVSSSIGGSPGSGSGNVVGDSNQDGVFNSGDLVAVFTAGEYEDDIDGNSTFEEGDWNGDGDFNTADLVFAFQTGDYSLNVRPLFDLTLRSQRDREYAIRELLDEFDGLVDSLS